MSSASTQPAEEYPSKPYLKPDGTLIIPHDCDPKYQYWKGGQSVLKTLEEVGASEEVMQGFKMLNNGAQGQYRRQASEKFIWYGVPELALPSFYTSQVCTVHALIDETVRQGELFKCPKCPINRHADEHAADTIGLYLLLKPFVTNTLLAQARSSVP